jgi:hypothetical protein
MKIPDDFKEVEKKINTIVNPYNIGDILYSSNVGGNRILYAFQVLKVTDKSITIQEINLDSNRKPIKDSFKLNSKPERKGIVKSKYSDYVGAYYDDWQLHKYIEQNEEKAV